MRLEDALAEFLAAKRAAGRSASTTDWYEVQINAFMAWLPDQPGDWFQTTTFERYYVYLAEERQLQPASVRGAHRALSAFFNWLLKRRYIPHNPIEQVEPPHVPRRQPRRTTPQEYEALLTIIPLNNWVGLRDHLMVQTLFLCGIRVSSLVRLTIDDYDVRNELLMIRLKGGDDHIIPLLDPVRRAFVAYLYSRPAWEGREVFLASDGGPGVDGVLTVNGVRQRLTKLCRDAGVVRLTPHRFRHGLARYMLDKGADMALIQRILGHQRLSTTSEIYALWDNLGAVIEQYERVMDDLNRPKR